MLMFIAVMNKAREIGEMFWGKNWIYHGVLVDRQFKRILISAAARLCDARNLPGYLKLKRS